MSKYCKKCGEDVSDLTKCPKCNTLNKSKKPLIIALILIALIIISIFVVYMINPGIISDITGSLNKSMKTVEEKVEENSNLFPDLKKKTITAENYSEIIEEIESKLKDDDELYYLSYSVMYHIMKDGLSASVSGKEDESSSFVNIYGKTVRELIEEGRKLMKEENNTIEKFKKTIEETDDAETVVLNNT